MLRFYDIDNNYIQYLKQYDPKVPDVIYDGNNKFICGVVLSINHFNYYAPISHFNEKQRTNLPIYDKGKIISTIRFCFMFPAPLNVLTEKNFKTSNNINTGYTDLLKTEYMYCKSIEPDIFNKAKSVYKIGCNPKHVFYKDCCKFKILEDAYQSYISK